MSGLFSSAARKISTIGALGVVVTVPRRMELGEFIVEFDADVPHAHDHPFAFERRAGLDVLGDDAQAFALFHQRFHRGPFLLGPLANALLLVFLFVRDQRKARQARFVIDRHRVAVFRRATDVGVVTEHRWRVDVVGLDGRAGETDEGIIAQGVAQILGKTIGDFVRYLSSDLSDMLCSKL